jgi:hypothetical protein
MDVLATFVSPKNTGPNAMYAKWLNDTYLDAFELYQNYVVSYIMTGDPNGPKPKTKLAPLYWPRPDLDGHEQYIGSVLDFGDNGIGLVLDKQLPKRNCDYIARLEQKEMSRAGYAPPGAPEPTYDEVYKAGIPTVMTER